MRTTLPPDLQKFVDTKLQSGAFTSVDEVVENALARWKADEEIDPAELRRLVAHGQAQADQGELIPGEEVFREIRERIARRRENLP